MGDFDFCSEYKGLVKQYTEHQRASLSFHVQRQKKVLEQIVSGKLTVNLGVEFLIFHNEEIASLVERGANHLEFTANHLIDFYEEALATEQSKHARLLGFNQLEQEE